MMSTEAKSRAGTGPARQVTKGRAQLLAAGCEVFGPGSDGYTSAIRLWNSAVSREPALISCCLTAPDVHFALAAARAWTSDFGPRRWSGLGRSRNTHVRPGDGRLVVDCSPSG